MDNTSSEQCSTVQYSTVEHSTVLCTGGTWDNGGGVVAVQAAPLRHHTGHCRETRDSGPPTPPTLLTPHTAEEHWRRERFGSLWWPIASVSDPRARRCSDQRPGRSHGRNLWCLHQLGDEEDDLPGGPVEMRRWWWGSGGGPAAASTSPGQVSSSP